MSERRGILIIDDDPVVQRVVASALAADYTVHGAASGEEGLAEFERRRPDLVLLDVMLPLMSGLAVLRALKRASTEVPVIMMTAYAEVQTAVQAIKLGAVDYLEKPLEAALVRREVDQAIARATSARESVRTAVVGRSAAARPTSRFCCRGKPGPAKA